MLAKSNWIYAWNRTIHTSFAKCTEERDKKKPFKYM